jgi:hypothetical protein
MEYLDGSIVVNQGSRHDEYVKYLMTRAEKIKLVWMTALWELKAIKYSSKKIERPSKHPWKKCKVVKVLWIYFPAYVQHWEYITESCNAEKDSPHF